MTAADDALDRIYNPPPVKARRTRKAKPSPAPSIDDEADDDADEPGATPAAPVWPVVTLRDLLAPAAAGASKVAATRSTIPIFKSVLVAARGEHVSLTATDGDRRVEYRVAATVEKPFALCVDAGCFAAALKHFPKSSEVGLGAEGDDRLTLVCGRNRITLEAVPESDFPDMGLAEVETAFDLAAADLARALGLVEHAIGTEEVRYYLNGALFAEDALANLAIVATDGHRLARFAIDMPDGGGGLSQSIVPAAAVADLIRLAEETGDLVALEFGDGKLRARLGPVVYTTRLIDGTYPDYERIIPKSYVATATCSAPDLALAIERAAVAAGKEKDRRHIRLDFAPGSIAVAARSDIADAESEVDAGSDITRSVGFHAPYLRAALAALGANQAAVSLQDDEGAVVITSPDVAELTLLVMPVRLAPGWERPAPRPAGDPS